MGEVATTLGQSCSEDTAMPWWCRGICRFREAWIGVALGVDCDEVANIYLFLYAKEAPYEAIFLELRRQSVALVRSGFDGQGMFYAPAHRTEYAYMDPLRILSEHQVPISEDDAIVVYTGLRFQGWVVSTKHAPLDFDEFCRELAPPAAAVAPQKRAASSRAPKLRDA